MTSAAQAHSLGSYRVIRRLGAGGMAEVFLASQHMAVDVARTVVIKAMLPHLADDDHFVQMFMREARVAALLSHPNLVNIHDVSVLDGVTDHGL
jgi:serine/threonine-protein kinase